MMAKTHVAFATTLALIPIAINPEIIQLINQDIKTLPIILIGITIGALIPDIDEPNSTISRLSIVTLLFSWMLILGGTQHRGFTHSFLFGFIFLGASVLSINLIDPLITIFLFAFTFGIYAHHLGDMMVGGGKYKGGIYDYFEPFVKTKSSLRFLPFFMRARIYSLKEKLYLFIFSVFNLFILAQIISTTLGKI